MKIGNLRMKRAAFTVLLTLLLSLAGVTKALAQTITVDGLNYSLNDDGVSVTVIGFADGADDTELVIPDAITQWGNTYLVTAIGGYAFDGRGNLTSVSIGNSVTFIGDGAFEHCNNLIYFTVPESVTYVGSSVFYECNLTALNYNATNCVVDMTWLNACSVTNLTIGENVMGIPNYFMRYQSSLVGELVIPESVVYIGEYAFINCLGLTGALVIPESVTIIGGSAFANCSGFTGTLVIPKSVTSIGNSAFANCSGFTGTLVIPESVTSIGNSAFANCSGFTGPLTIPHSVTSIGELAFTYCTGFSGTLTLGTSVAQIGNSAFFGACENFTSFILRPETPPSLGEYTFISVDYDIPVLVQCGTLDAYQNASNWSQFTNIQETNPCMWEIMATANHAQCGTISGTGFYDQGQTCTLTATPNEDYVFVKWVENNEEVSTEASYSFAVTSNRNLVAHFRYITYNVFVDVRPDIGGIVSGDNGLMNNGGWQHYDNNSYFANLGDGDGLFYWGVMFPAGSYEGNMVTAVSMYDSQEISGNGNILICQGGTNAPGAVLYTQPYTCSGIGNFVEWSLDIPVVIDPSQNLWIVMNCDNGQYLASCCGSSGNPNGRWISLDGYAWEDLTNFGYDFTWMLRAYVGYSIGSYLESETCTLTATPNEGWEFNNWWENGTVVSTDGLYSFTVTSNRMLEARFRKPNTITFADPTVEARCLELWDTDGDGYLSYNEAAAVTNLDYAFQSWGITSFDELQYFTGLTSLNDYEFYDCESLTSITLPENITYIGYYAFAYCYSLSSINLLSVTPPGLNWCAFCEIYSNNNIIISVPCGATGNYQNNDGWNVFSNYYEPGDCIYEIVATANIEEGGTVNGAGSYQRGQTCTLIATASEGRSFVHWIENNQEVSTDATYSFTVMGPRNLVAVFSALASEIITFADPNVKAICVNHWDTDGDGELTYAEAAAVTNLGGAFSSNQNITSFDELQYFTGLTFIGDYEFYYCSNLTSIVIPENVTSIGYQAFLECYNLGGTLTINENVTYIGWGAFYYTNFSTLNYNAINCEMGGQWLEAATSSLTTLTIGESVEVIPYAAFQDCYNVTGELVIPNSVTYIGAYAFYNCSSLTSVTIPEGITSIEEATFDWCSGLETVNLPNSVETIGNWAFYGCISLTNLVLPNALTSIGYEAFTSCHSLTGTLELPASVTSIGDDAFEGCSGLTGLILSDNIQSIGYYAFKNCSGLRGELTLPESLESVGGYAFYGCDGISTVNYNATNCQTMGSAGEPVFYDCAFEHIRIGENVQSIPNYAFKHCFLVKDIASAAVNPPTIYSSTFGMVSRNIPVSVPLGSSPAYRTAQYWEEFFHITEDYSPNSYTYHWNVNVNQFASNMTVTGIIQIEGVEQSVPSLEIGAFCNGECRGRQLLTYYPQVDRYLVFLMLYGEDGDVFTFRLYDHEASEELTAGCASVITFEADAIVGSFLAPYVFNFTDMQLTQFSEGWNWWSTYVEQGGIDGLSLLQESLGDNGVAIRSQASGYTDYYAGYGWYGSLESINNESSYRVVTSAPCVASMPGNVAIPSQHPITLSQGWTWIGYLPSSAMDINAALEGLEATQGDMVKSQQGYSDYYPGYGWFGSLNTVEPGMGLMYYSTNGETVTFTYPDNGRGGEPKKNLTADHNHWKPNTFAYPDNMTVMAVVELNDEELSNENYELAVFATNGECRGSVKLTYAEPINRHVAFLTISGKDAAELNFRLYDMETGMEYYDAEESLDFVANAIIGEADDLYTIHFRGTTGMDELVGKVQVYPNPVNAGERFSINVADDSMRWV